MLGVVALRRRVRHLAPFDVVVEAPPSALRRKLHESLGGSAHRDRSSENWRWPEPQYATADRNTSREVVLERDIVSELSVSARPAAAFDRRW